MEITSDRVTAYIAYRQREARNSTINNELSALGRMFTLAIRAGKAASKPYISKLKTDNVRKVFFEREELEAVVAHLPHHLRAAIRTAYICGWRIHDEIFTRQRSHVDLRSNPGWLRLEPGETKNGDGRMFPLTPELRQILEKQIELTEALQREKSMIISHMFHRDGKPIKSFRRAWLTACVKAGLGTEIRDSRGKLVKKISRRIPHDFRRSAIRNLERAGVARSAAMKMVSHKTQSIYSRYAIADESMLKDAALKLAALTPV